jgi:peptidyl-dipeptidase Dcp
MLTTSRHCLWGAALLLLLSPSPASVLAQGPPPQAQRANPLLAESTLPYGAPNFALIRDTDYEPAIRQGMIEHRNEVQRIVSNPEPPTFLNTIEALERSGLLLSRVSRVFGALVSANTNPTLQASNVALAPDLAAHRDAITLNAELFARIKRVYDQRASAGLTAEQIRVVERYYRNFVRAGAMLTEAQKGELRALNREQSELTTSFRDKVLADANAASQLFDSVAPLEGLSSDDLGAAAAAASNRGQAGKWLLRMQNTTQQPLFASLKNRDVRQQIFKASTSRNSAGENDTTGVITRLAQLRATRAKLLGFETHAAFTLDNQMAKTPQAAVKLLTDLVPAVKTQVSAEAGRIQRMMDAEQPGRTLEPWDWAYYAEQVRKADYDLDESAIRPYFEIDRVLRDGVFFAATRLYGITFKERSDLPVYHPDVRVFEVFDRDGSGLGLIYIDYFARPSKDGGGWTDSFVPKSGLFGTRAVLTNTCNFTKPAAGAPALISFADVTTMFHEFGHALNGFFSEVRYPMLGGLPRDFGEVPSQFNEHWALELEVFSNYARHYQTGERMPAALEARIRKASTFNQGFMTAELLAASLLDMGWHLLPAAAPLQNASQFETATLTRYGMLMPQVPPRYSSRYFLHIWANGYSAGYYSYLWSMVIDNDAFYWFKEHGGMTRENGQRFRDQILSKGGTVDADVMYRAFRGRDASVEPLLIERGLSRPN